MSNGPHKVGLCWTRCNKLIFELNSLNLGIWGAGAIWEHMSRKMKISATQMVGQCDTRQTTQMNCFYQRVMARRGKCHTNVMPHDVHPKCLSPILTVNFYLKVVSANQQNRCTNKCNMFDGCGKVWPHMLLNSDWLRYNIPNGNLISWSYIAAQGASPRLRTGWSGSNEVELWHGFMTEREY